jgi:molybdopterin-synthase adenylyltransferase
MTRFVLIGVGGLGCPLALELGLGGDRLVLIDDDVVELSNLPRQILFRTADVGRPKVEAAADALVRRGVPAARIETVAARWSGELGDVVCEGSDSLATKFAVNDACVAAGVPLVIGGVLRHEGQVFPVAPGGPCYRCLFEAPPDDVPSCADAGVLGPTCGVVAALMARCARGLAAGEAPDGVWLVPSLRRLELRPRPGCCAPEIEVRA